jgi:hypothetical protein
MINNSINTIINSIKLYFKIALRLLLILFRKDKHIKELYFDSGYEVIFEDSLLIINYRFKNAIYYKINNKITLENKIKIFNVKNIDSEIHFIVYGWFENKQYVIEVSPNKSLNNESFRTQLSRFNISLIVPDIPKLVNEQINITTKNVHIETSKVFILNKKVQIKTNSFTQNDFL